MQFMPLKKVAEEFGCSLRTVKRWTKNPAHRLKTARAGKTIVTTREWLEEFVLPEQEVQISRNETKKFKAKWEVRGPVCAKPASKPKK